MSNNSNLYNQNTQIETNKAKCDKSGHKTIVILLVLLLVASNIGTYILMSKQLANKNNKLNKVSNQLDASNTKIAELEARAKELSDKASKEQEAKVANLSMTVEKSEIVNRPNEASTLFVTLTLKNNSQNNYEFKVGDIKIKNSSGNALEVYFAYPELYGYNSSSPLKDQTITTGESINGFLQVPLSETKTKPESFDITFTDNATGVSVASKTEAKIRNL